MEYLILGLLILSPMTGYEVQQFIRKNLALICSHSADSVQTALSKLEKSGKVASRETAAGKRRKKTFSITEEGRAAFSAWVAQPMRANRRIWSCPGCSLPDWPGRRNGLPPSGTTSDRWRIPESRCARSGTVLSS